MASIFIEPTSSEGWTIAQHRTAEAIGPVIRSYLAAQMRRQAACDRFYDAQKAVTRVRHINHAEWQAAVRIPVMVSLSASSWTAPMPTRRSRLSITCSARPPA